MMHVFRSHRARTQRNLFNAVQQIVSVALRRLTSSQTSEERSLPCVTEVLESRRLLSTVNVTSYGAVPNDGNNDQTTIENAIAAASSGDIVFFPSGVYDLGALTGHELIELKAGVTFRGESGSVLKRDAGELAQDDATFYATGSNASNILIERLTFDGAGIKFGNESGTWANNVDINNCVFQNAIPTDDGLASMIDIADGASNSDITNNVFRNLDCFAGIYARNVEYCRILDNRFDTVDEGVQITNFEDGKLGVEVSRNHFTGVALTAIEIQDGGPTAVAFDGLKVQDNIVSDFRPRLDTGTYDVNALSIVPDQAVNTLIEGNKLFGILLGSASYLDQPTYGIEVAGDSGTEVNDNLIEGFWTPISAYAWPDPSGSMDLDGNRIRGEYNTGLTDGIERHTGATYNVTNHNSSRTVEPAVVVGDDLIVKGTSSGDTISLTGTSSITVTIGGVGKGTYTPTGGVLVYSADGADTVSVASALGFSATVCGGTGNDTLSSNNSAGQIYGDDGNDSITGGTAGDVLHGGEGTDTVNYSARTLALSITLDGVANDGATSENDNVSSIEIIQTGSANDTVVGDSNANTINSNAGNDSIAAGAGDDSVDAGAGDDTVDGGYGDDYLYGSGNNDSISGGEGADTLFGGTTGADTLLGGNGNDSLSGSAGASGITIFGGAGDDTIIGSSFADSLSGEDGSDSIVANAGNDTISGGNQGDTVDAGAGDDVVNGGSGHDYLYGSGDNDTMDGGSGNDTLFGGTTGNDSLLGGDGDDSIDGQAGSDTLRGGNDNDTITGGTGIDSIFGDAGNDRFFTSGDGANDSIDGGLGSDTITGDAGDYKVNIEF